jgi:organic radical activating enzyme
VLELHFRRMSAAIRYRTAETYLFDTCSMKCGYCWLAETGRVLDSPQLTPFRDIQFIDKITNFFNSRTTANFGWILQLTGGEPLLMPNLDRFCENLSRRGNKVSFYTSLFVDQNQGNFQFLLATDPNSVDYIMASLHPEAEADENQFFQKLESLKRVGHRVFLRFVGHPARLHRLEELAERCRGLDVAFYPTTLLTDFYPAAYSAAQRDLLETHFASLSQFIQLRGGVDTRTTRCWAANRVIAVNLQTGNITPCISVGKPSIGNIFENRLELSDSPILCPDPGIACVCDVHYQQDVVIHGFDGDAFTRFKSGYVMPKRFEAELMVMASQGITFHNGKTGMGSVADDTRLYYTIEEVKERRKRDGMARPVCVQTGGETDPLFRLVDLTACAATSLKGTQPVEIITPERQWSYAALVPALIRNFGQHETLIVRLEFSIERGRVGVGCVASNMSTFVGEPEKSLIVGDTICDIRLRRADAPAWLVLRNVAADGHSSILKLSNIQTFVGR